MLPLLVYANRPEMFVSVGVCSVRMHFLAFDIKIRIAAHAQSAYVRTVSCEAYISKFFILYHMPRISGCIYPCFLSDFQQSFSRF
jgi:hypothetical protein